MPTYNVEVTGKQREGSNVEAPASRSFTVRASSEEAAVDRVRQLFPELSTELVDLNFKVSVTRLLFR